MKKGQKSWTLLSDHSFRFFYGLTLLLGVSLARTPLEPVTLVLQAGLIILSLKIQRFVSGGIFARKAANESSDAELPASEERTSQFLREENFFFRGQWLDLEESARQDSTELSAAMAPARMILRRLALLLLFALYCWGLFRFQGASLRGRDFLFLLCSGVTVFSIFPEHLLLSLMIDAAASWMVIASGEKWDALALLYLGSLFVTLMYYRFLKNALHKHPPATDRVLFTSFGLLAQAMAIGITVNALVPEKKNQPPPSRPSLGKMTGHRMSQGMGPETGRGGEMAAKGKPGAGGLLGGNSSGSSTRGAGSLQDLNQALSQMELSPSASASEVQTSLQMKGLEKESAQLEEQIRENPGANLEALRQAVHNRMTAASETGHGEDTDLGQEKSGTDATRPLATQPPPPPSEILEWLRLWTPRIAQAAAVIAILSFLYLLFLRRTRVHPPAFRRKLSAQERAALQRELNTLNATQLTPEDEIVQKYHFFLRVMKTVGHPRASWLPPHEYCRTIEPLFRPENRESPRTLTETFCDVFYGELPIASETLAAFRGHLTVICRQMARLHG